MGDGEVGLRWDSLERVGRGSIGLIARPRGLFFSLENDVVQAGGVGGLVGCLEGAVCCGCLTLRDFWGSLRLSVLVRLAFKAALMVASL